MIDDLVIATYVLAGFTAALVVVTVFYSYYTKQQVKLLKIGHELTKRDIAIKAVQAHAASPGGGYVDEDTLNLMMKQMGLEKIG